MPKIETRINPENGKTEYFINYPVKNLQSLEELINTINSRKDNTTPIFITQPITLKNITISLVTAIHNCVFENETTIQNCTFNGEFNGVKFHGKTSFEGTTFEKKVRFHHCIFHERVYFDNAKFKNLIDFFDSTFEKEQQFYKVDFEDVGVFSNTHFKGETQFLYCTTTSKTYLNFESATFEKCLDLSRSNFNNNINFWNITINGDDKISEYKHYKNSFGIHKNPPSSYRLIRESYRKIKKSFSDNGDKIGEVEYNSREQNIYKKELKEITTKSTTKLFKYLFYFLSYELIFILLLCIFINYPFLSFIISGLYPFIYFFIIFCKNFIIFCKNINDLSMLYLNKWSNNYGRSWIRGIFFTLLIGMIVFGALSSNTNLIFKFEKVGVENFIHDFIKIINILDLKPFDDENENSLFSESKDWVFYLILFIGRIFIGYGYYQTIQAFRKYGKS